MLVDTVQWTGNNTDDREISFSGELSSVTPDLVIVKSSQGDAMVWSSDTMVSGESGYLGFSLANASGLIKSLTSGGFTVGTDSTVNASSLVYRAIGFYDDGNGDFATFTYTGDGTDPSNRDILSFQPCFLTIKRDSNTNAVCKFEEQTGDATFKYQNTAAETNKIQAFRSLGFELGSDAQVNNSGATYHGFAFKNVDGFIDSHTYTGDGNDNRTIAVQGTTFKPDFVVVKQDGIQNVIFNFHVATDLSYEVDAGSWPQSNYIQDRTSTGFEVGDDNRVNQNTETYYYLALVSNPVSAASPTISSVDSPVLDAETGNALTTSNYSGDITGLTIEDVATGNYVVDVSASISGTSGSFTFDMPDVSGFTTDTLGTPFDSSSHTHTITATYTSETDSETIVVNPKANWNVIELASPVTTEGSLFNVAGGWDLAAPANADQVYYYSTEIVTDTDPAYFVIAADGTITTNISAGTVAGAFFDQTDYKWYPFTINLGVASIGGIANFNFGLGRLGRR